MFLAEDYFVQHVRLWLEEGETGVDGYRPANEHVLFLQEAFEVMRKMRLDSVVK